VFEDDRAGILSVLRPVLLLARTGQINPRLSADSQDFNGVPKKAKSNNTGKPGKKPERASFKGVTKSLRTYLGAGPHTILEMIAALTVTEDAVLFGLRRLGKSKKGTLRSGMVEGRPCWWWEADEVQPGKK
jgi:hypothetical protein